MGASHFSLTDNVGGRKDSHMMNFDTEPFLFHTDKAPPEESGNDLLSSPHLKTNERSDKPSMHVYGRIGRNRCQLKVYGHRNNNRYQLP